MLKSGIYEDMHSTSLFEWTSDEGARIASPIPSLIKWTGSKRSTAHQIAKFVPPHNRYIEPFVGGGALLYCLARPGSVASDLYQPLIEIWRAVQSDPAGLVRKYADDWSALQNQFPEYFYEVRERFNADPNGQDLLFLSRTCTNGIIRFNSKGEFNNSLHVTRRGMKPQRFKEVVIAWHNRIKGVTFQNADYQGILAETKTGDFVYLDPPYAGSNNRYVASLDKERLFASLEALNKRDVKWALSYDGTRGKTSYTVEIPRELYRQKIMLKSGLSAVKRVLGENLETVEETLLMNYEH